MSDILEIACDESGYTGPDLLQKDQRFFAYASVEISDGEAFELIQRARADHPVQMPELKARILVGSERGRKLIAELLSGITGRYVVNINDKLLALCGWFFEYIYEPVYQDDPWLLYEKDLHRFVAMFSWLWMNDHQSQARIAIAEFQVYMRSGNPADAPFLFNSPRPPLTDEGKEHPYESILRFAYGYRDLIIRDNTRMKREVPDRGRWTLDLSASALWSHLNYWGAKGKLLSVRCDNSKPLQAIVGRFTGDEADPGISRARAKNKKEQLGWRLQKAIDFVDSRSHPAVQLADVIAGTMVMIAQHDFPEELRAIGEAITPHVHTHSIVPDLDLVDPSNRSAAVNALILCDLAKRAERHSDPYEGLAAMYRAAEISWTRGESAFGRK
jgi:hypothetical protein